MKKKLIIAAAVGAVAAAAVPAMALENEFHGMYKFMGFQTNFFTGEGNPAFEKDANSGFFAEQRARLNYIAKANDNLKLVTHFELDSRFGGKRETYLGAGNDAGNLDADQLTLETKNIYLDFNCPITGTNLKVGLQPWADAYNSLFLLADMTGVYATKKFGDQFTASLGWFRYDDNTINLNTATPQAYDPDGPGDQTGDLLVLDTKFAINKDMKVGFTYYNVQNDIRPMTFPGQTATSTWSEPHYEMAHVFGLNADLTFGPANIKPFFVYETGEVSDAANVDLKAYMGGVVSKIKAGPGAVNFSAIYLSGMGENDDDLKAFQPLTAGTTYFNPANMWFLVRNGQQINSSTSVLGNDLTVGGHGMIGVFAGYEGTMDKLFYNANIGWAQAAEAWGDEKKGLGTEINAQVGYKLFDNLTASVAVAYMFLDKGLDGDATERLHKGYGTAPGGVFNQQFGAEKADDPYMFNVQLSYVF